MLSGRRVAMAGLSGLAVLSVGSAAWLGIEAIRLDDEVATAQRGMGSASRILELERDLARLQAAIAGAPGSTAVARYSDLRGSLGTTLAAEAMGGRLEPHDVEFLAHMARDLDQLIATGGLDRGEAEAAQRLSAAASELAAIGTVAMRRESDVRAAVDEAGAIGALRTQQALLAAGAALLAAVTALILRRSAVVGIDPAVVEAQRAAMDEAARLSRARFVMMMSHELRTPLNGVLGLLSVMREAQPPDTLRPLIEQAERAGQQLTAMLHDMLEVESGEAAAMTQPETPATPTFSPAGVVQSLKDLYGPVSARGGPSFSARVRGKIPDEATGDGMRFQRAVSHLCNHVMDTAGVEDVEVALSHTGKEVQAELSFGHKAGQAAAMRIVEPEAGSAEAGDEVTGVGLGPLLAKGLLEQLGGRLEITSLDSGRVLVLAATPSEPLAEADDAHAQPRVRVLAQTRSLGALGTAAASAAGVEVLTSDTAPQPDIVLVEAGGEEEARAVAEARGLWPDSYIMALGTPDVADLFDDTIHPPLDPVRVADSVMRAWRHCQERGDRDTAKALARRVG